MAIVTQQCSKLWSRLGSSNSNCLTFSCTKGYSTCTTPSARARYQNLILRIPSSSNYSNQQHFSIRKFSSTFKNLTLKSDEALSKCRQNYHDESEVAINEQINLELYASFVYLSMAYYFNRDDVALPGLHKYFKKQSDEEREHAEILMKYQNARGGRLIMKSIQKPEKDNWGTALDAMNQALELEKKLNENLLHVHQVAENHTDPHLEDFIEKCLDEQVKAIKELGDYITNLKMVGTGLGEYIFDKEEFEE